MAIFAYIAFYGIPVIAYLFIVSILRAIQKIVRDEPYGKELFWSGISFAIIIWTISMIALMGTE